MSAKTKTGSKAMAAANAIDPTDSTQSKSLSVYNRLWFIMLVSAGLGGLLFVLIYGVRILDPTYDEWLFEGGDLTQHYLGWLYFRRSDWHFPVGLMDGVLGKIKMSVMYTDSVPILAVFFKLLSPILPDTFQYYGFLGLGSFMLGGACSSLLIRRFSSSGIFCILGSTIYTVSPVVLQRLYGHESLACHFVIVLGLILWVYQEHEWKKKWQKYAMPPILWGLLGIVAVWVHLYYLPMVYCFLLGCFFTDIFRYRNIHRPCFCFASITLASMFAMWFIGAFHNNSDISAQGLGENSANINTFWNPLEIYGNGMIGYSSTGSLFFSSINVNNGQYEGYAYVGFGVMLAAAFTLIVLIVRAIRSGDKLPGAVKAMVKSRRIWLIAGAAVFAVSMLYAVSPSGYFNSTKIYDIYIPERIIGYMSAFRATGRFAWVGMHLIFTAVLYGLSRISSKRLMAAALAVCVAFQFADMSGQIYSRRWYKEKHTYTPLLSDPRWELLAEGCDKFIGLPYDQPQPYTYAFSIFAYRHNMTINHFHIARPPLDDIIAQYNETIEQIKNGNIDPDALYVFISQEHIPDVKGASVYELDGFYAVKFAGQHDPLK